MTRKPLKSSMPKAIPLRSIAPAADTNYYILGAHREDHESDIFRQMRDGKLVDIGYGWKQKNLRPLVGKSEAEIVSKLKQRGEKTAAYTALKHLLRFKEGDWVAIKKFSYARGKDPILVIHGYARIVKRNGELYRRRVRPFTHTIHAEYFDAAGPLEFPFTYGQSVHKITDRKRIKRIFGPVFKSESVKKLLHKPQSPRKDAPYSRRSAALTKSIEDQIRRYSRTVRARQEHNKLQLKLKEQLTANYGAANVTMEQDFVDLRVTTPTAIHLYEVKPFSKAGACVRSALGQLCLYAWSLNNEERKVVKLIIAGPNRPTKVESEFTAFLRKSLQLDLCYRAINKR